MCILILKGRLCAISEMTKDKLKKGYPHTLLNHSEEIIDSSHKYAESNAEIESLLQPH